tara:strand:- start:193 stop:2004 length:1812 start_codon:yes stop_codon:yes gene_type:complete
MTFIIGSNTSKKFKKLYHLSSNIINKYGLRYFLRILLEESRSQKLGLLKPDSEPKIDLASPISKSSFRSYQNYLKKLDLDLSRKDIVVNQLNQLNFKPKLSILVIPKNENIKKIKSLFQSIKEQVYDNYEIIILTSDQDNLKNLITKNLETGVNNEIINKITYVSKINDLIKNIHGDFVCFLESGNILSKDALFRICIFLNKNIDSEIIYTDHDYLDAKGARTIPFFKPDWSPYLFLSMDYLSPLCLIKKEIFKKITLDEVSEHIFPYDVILKATEQTTKIKHVTLPLCSVTKKSTLEYFEKTKNAIISHMHRKKINAKVDHGILPETFRINYSFENEPLISIIIPTKNNKKILNRCIKSIEQNTSYKNWEIIIVDNNSTDEITKSYYKSLRYKILNYKKPFNFSKLNNHAVKYCKGDLLLFLNDDIKVLEHNWLQEMVSLCNQNDVGAVGPKLVYSDDTIQHAGVTFLKTGTGFHPFQRIKENESGYHNLLNVVKDCSAVTGACLLTKKEIFEKVNRFDEDFDLYYGDADLCLKIIDSGYSVVYTPFAKLLHEGSFSIQKSSESHFAVENYFHFIEKWPNIKQGDPFYNPNLGWNYSLEYFE